MDIMRVIGVAIIGALIQHSMRFIKNEYSVYVILATGVVLLIIIINKMGEVLEVFWQLQLKSGIDEGLFAGMIKIIGIGYLTEYSAGLCRDLQADSIAAKVELYGKITIFILTIPIITALLDTLNRIIKLV